MAWRRFARYACALAAASLLLTAGAYAALRDPATLQAAAAATAAATAASAATASSSASSTLLGAALTSYLQPLLTGLQLVATDAAGVLPRWALAAAALLGLLLPAVMTAMPRQLQVRLMRPLMMRGVWSYCPDMKDMYGHWSRPEEGREYYVAVGLRELSPAGPADSSSSSSSSSSASGDQGEPAAAVGKRWAEEGEVVLGGVAIKAGAGLRPLPPPAADCAEQTAVGRMLPAAASAAGVSGDDKEAEQEEEQQGRLRQRKPPPAPAAAVATAAAASKSPHSSSATATAKASKDGGGGAHGTGAGADAELPTGFCAGESGYHDNPGPCDILVFRMVVDPTVRRRGVGRRLMVHVMGRAAAVGGARVLLATGNPEAVRFYEACGFSKDGLKQPHGNLLGRAVAAPAHVVPGTREEAAKVKMGGDEEGVGQQQQQQQTVSKAA
ncbi:hypothetical protein HYH02_014955 [Chlamydomonas schloesseri]|nr:hypothetical protein HYH02_014955 [Chlamydomonas schloesseri]|eukprot:KAG2425739.1 hypothetical protein HYH02_014955 [Chlamydomonas schloesseri]